MSIEFDFSVLEDKVIGNTTSEEYQSMENEFEKLLAKRFPGSIKISIRNVISAIKCIYVYAIIAVKFSPLGKKSQKNHEREYVISASFETRCATLQKLEDSEFIQF